MEEIQFDSKRSIIKENSISQPKGYATCSKEISQPSEWKVDEEDEVPQRKILTMP